MKLLYFDDFRLGVLSGDNVVDVLSHVQDIPHLGPHDLISGLIEHFDDYREGLEKAAAADDGFRSTASVPVSPCLGQSR